MIKPPYHTYPMADVTILGTADGNVLEYMLPDGVNEYRLIINGKSPVYWAVNYDR